MPSLEFVIISRFFSGLHESIKDKELKPTGIPAFINFAQYAKKSYKIIWIIVCKTHQESSIINHKDHFFNLNGIKFIVIPYKKYFFDILGINSFINDLITFFKVIKSIGNKKEGKIIYTDRSNLIPSALLKRLIGFKTVIRILGLYPDQKKIVSSLKYKLLHPLRYIAYKTKFDLAIGTQDGSGIELFFDRLMNKNTPKHILINGTNVSPRVINPNPENVKLLYVGTLSPSKGIKDLLISIRELSLEHKNFTLTIVGKGPLYEECKNFIDTNDLSNHVKAIGAIDKQKLSDIYKQSDVYISTNRLGNISNTVLEAAGSGLCMILLGEDENAKTDYFSKEFWADNVIYVDRKGLSQNLSKQIQTVLCDTSLITNYSKKIGKFATLNLNEWDERIKKELSLILNIL